MHNLCILETILHTNADQAFNAERISFFTPVAHLLSISLTLLLRIRPPWSAFSFAAVLELAADAPAPYLLPRLRGGEVRGPLLGVSAFFCFVCRVIEMETGGVVWVGGPPIFLPSRIDDGIS
jgi:hypothetical protein